MRIQPALGQLIQLLPPSHPLREDSARLARIALAYRHTPGDPVLAERLERLGAIALAQELLDAPGGAELAQRIATDIAHTDATGAITLIPGDDTWPTALDDLTDTAPFVIWVRGNPQHLASADRITLVGGHEPTRYGRAIANDFAAGLATRSYAICTGTGTGTHQVIATAALAAGGTLIIALPGGIGSAAADVDETVLEQILDGHGCIISEYPPSEPATRLHGMNRNRLLAALTLATIALECGERSDAIQVAGHARVLGRFLGAVPGSVYSPAAGAHRLIRGFGAELVTHVDDVDELVRGVSETWRDLGSWSGKAPTSAVGRRVQ